LGIRRQSLHIAFEFWECAGWRLTAQGNFEIFPEV